MIIRKNAGHRGLLLACGAVPVLLGFVAMPAAAAAPAAEELQEVTVTGSILRRTDTETPSPVAVITAEDLEKRGINTVAEAVQRLSVNGSGAMSQGWNNGSNFASGASAPSLRGLTVQATLTVFDGLRMAPYPLADDGHRQFVDINTIPQAVVERIEVLKDGASSTYGADAIAGVVNVITKQEVTGLHMNASGGGRALGGGRQVRADATWGIGKLSDDGYNFYVNAEYQKDSPIWARQLSYPFNSSNLSGVCDTFGRCLQNYNAMGINHLGTLSNTSQTNAPLVAPSSAAGVRSGVYRLLNTSAGCNIAPGLTPITLTAAQAGTAWDPTQCSQDLRNQFSSVQPETKRLGGFSRYTMQVGDNHQLRATLAYYQVKSYTQISPLNLNNQTTAPRVSLLNPVVLPVYVCAAGVGTIGVSGVNTSSGCTAANGTLNPNNPFASTGGNAILRWRYDRPRTVETDAKSTRFDIGMNGLLAGDWTYSANLTGSKVKLNRTGNNYLIPQRIADVVAQGTFNFVNPSSNTEAIRQYLAPTSSVDSTSDLWQAQVVAGKKLMDLSGGPLQTALGLSYRNEKNNAPSANPDNAAAPYNRYYSLNAVGASGSRNVQSAFFEVGAPFVKQLEANLSGRYDKYSSGQKNFSPKLGLKYQPTENVALRSTYSRGFRIPSFNESYGLPTTGYSTSGDLCPTYTAFCNAHAVAGVPNSYASGSYSIGTTATGNPSLNPEKSRSYTAGIVWEPRDNLVFKVDYWNIQVRDLISQVSAGDRAAAIDQYYRNNGVVNIPGIRVVPAVPDVQFPNALPLLGFIEFSYNNSDRQDASGIDFEVETTTKLTDGLRLDSRFEAAWLSKYTVTRKDGSVERYEGTLSPCDYTSCSGSPRLRGSFSNTLSWEKLSVTGTAYYTSGYNLAEVDYGGDPNNCAGNGSGHGAPFYVGTSVPSACSARAQWNFDLGARYKINDKLTIYGDALNVLNIGPVFDPAATYEITQYNAVWGYPNAIGRFLRVGLKVDL